MWPFSRVSSDRTRTGHLSEGDPSDGAPSVGDAGSGTLSADEQLTGERLRERLIDAAMTGEIDAIRAACGRYHRQVPDHVDVIRTMPDELLGERVPEEVRTQYVQALSGIAYCLATEFRTPQLYDALATAASDETAADIAECERALADADADGDVPGQLQALSRLLAIHDVLGTGRAADYAGQIRKLCVAHGIDTAAIDTRIAELEAATDPRQDDPRQNDVRPDATSPDATSPEIP